MKTPEVSLCDRPACPQAGRGDRRAPGQRGEDVVDAVYGSLESGLLRLVRQNGSSLRIEPCGDVAARRAAREANRRLMKVLRARMPDGHAFED
jgi:hypothetical protein